MGLYWVVWVSGPCIYHLLITIYINCNNFVYLEEDYVGKSNFVKIAPKLHSVMNTYTPSMYY